MQLNSSSPYHHPVLKLLELLEAANIITSENQQEATFIAQNLLNANSDIISIDWHIDDIREQANIRNLQLSDEQCLEILSILEDTHDATIGISWDTIDCALDSLDYK